MADLLILFNKGHYLLSSLLFNDASTQAPKNVIWTNIKCSFSKITILPSRLGFLIFLLISTVIFVTHDDVQSILPHFKQVIKGHKVNPFN